jgi:NADPH:quinone reductase-like Zn-dependent oxidoreductase
MARTVRFHAFGGPEVLRIEDIDVPAPRAGEVRIRVKAVGLNRADALFRSGRYIEAPASLPASLGLEAAGIVESLGEGVRGLAAGDAVSVIPPVSMARWPAHGELVTFPAELVVRHPPSLGWEAAASIWMQYLTAYGALVDIAGVRPGEFVVITAASSSVGLAAIQTTRLLGAIPIAVTRTATKKRILLAHGAAHAIASSEEDLGLRLREISGPAGARIIFDPVAGPLFETLTAAMAKGGILIEYGGLSREPTPFPIAAVLGKSLTLRGYLVHELVTDAVRLEAAKRFILHGLASGALRPVIAKAFDLANIVEAHRFLESNAQVGKIVVTI